MRTIYTLIMGLVLFNAFLVVFGPYFNISAIENAAIDVNDENMSVYDPRNTGDQGYGVTLLTRVFSFGDTWSGLIGGVLISLIGIGVALATKNYIYIGVTLFLGLVVGTYIQMSSVIYSIGAGISDQYGIVQGILAATGIAIGLLIAFAVVDMFAPSPTR